MELGNMIFGNSRGNFPIPDRSSYQEVFAELLYKDNEYRFDQYQEIDNDVFTYFHYYWGDCTCGFDEKDSDWWEANKHTINCFSVRMRKYTDEIENQGIKLYSDKYIELVDKWAIENGWEHGFSGSGSHCDCGLHDSYDKWRETNYHDTKCPSIRPNFVYKPTGLEIQWYKYPLRDSYTNMEVSLEELRAIVKHCISVLEEKTL